MSWFSQSEPQAAPAANRRESIELVGVHLRMTGSIELGRFGRLSDLMNYTEGYVQIEDARLLRRNGEPTTLQLPRIMVNKDEISFIAQTETAPSSRGAGGDPSQYFSGDRSNRRFVLFTPGHTVTGSVLLFAGTELASFVDASDRRFVPVTDVRTRSLYDRRIVGHYLLALVNRTQMIAVSEVGESGEIGT